MAEITGDAIDYDNPPFPLTAIDREVLATKDEDYHRTTWEDLKRIIGKCASRADIGLHALHFLPGLCILRYNRLTRGKATNSLEQLKRLPSDLRRYLAWSYDIKKRYGGITNFVIQERLHWTSNPARSGKGPVFEHRSDVPFADHRDFAVLQNDWPYGFQEGIVHLLVWSKTPIAVDDVQGDVTPKDRKVIDDFVREYFVKPLGEGGNEKVQWFKNWVSLQSVRGVDHVHVLVRDAPSDLLERWIERNDL